MRYRRLLEHVKEQNWLAILLDFFIVVLGILIAFQITESASARKEQQELDRALTNVAQEILETTAASEQHIKFSERVIEGLVFTLDAMKSQKPLSDDEMQKVKIALMRQAIPPPTNFRITTLLELQNSGKLKDIMPDNLRNDLKLWLSNKDNLALFNAAKFRGISLPDIPLALINWDYAKPEGTTSLQPVIVDFDLAAAHNNKILITRLMTIISLYQDKIRIEKQFILAGNDLLDKLKTEGYEAANSRYLELQDKIKKADEAPN